jgi:hypothetical protein
VDIASAVVEPFEFNQDLARHLTLGEIERVQRRLETARQRPPIPWLAVVATFVLIGSSSCIQCRAFHLAVPDVGFG